MRNHMGWWMGLKTRNHETGFSWQIKIPPNLMIAVGPWRVGWTGDDIHSLRNIPGKKSMFHILNFNPQKCWFLPICRTRNIAGVWTGYKMVGCGGARSYTPLTYLLTIWTKFKLRLTPLPTQLTVLEYSFHIEAIGGRLRSLASFLALLSSITLGLLSLIASDSEQLLDQRGIQLGGLNVWNGANSNGKLSLW